MVERLVYVAQYKPVLQVTDRLARVIYYRGINNFHLSSRSKFGSPQ